MEFSREETEEALWGRSNWGRWGDDDEVGAVNLVTPAKRTAAAATVRTGRTVSLSRDLRVTESERKATRTDYDLEREKRDAGAGGAVDYLGFWYHGYGTTHIDALCHAWDGRGMWNGRKPDEVISPEGSSFAGIDKWSSGIVTRGVLLDVPQFRGAEYVEHDLPVTDDELQRVAAAEGVEVLPGDALVVYSGRDRWDATRPSWGSERTDDGVTRCPGLDASCLDFLRRSDCSVLAWDMADAHPNPGGVPWTVHGALYSYGVALIDNCHLGPLAEACREEGRYDFLLLVLPLKVVGGTGSPVNPVAMF